MTTCTEYVAKPADKWPRARCVHRRTGTVESFRIILSNWTEHMDCAVTKRSSNDNRNTATDLMFVDPCIIVQFTKKNPTRCNSVSKFYFIFIRSSTCFGRHTAHHQEPKTALAASGFAYVESCWTCSCWTLSASSNYTSNNPPRMQNQRLLVQF